MKARLQAGFHFLRAIHKHTKTLAGIRVMHVVYRTWIAVVN